MKKTYYILALLALLAALVLLLEFPFSVSVTGKVYPLQRWSVYHYPNGNIQSKGYNYLSGRALPSKEFLFERGDIVEVDFTRQQAAAAGDTLLLITSFELRRQLERLREDLAVQRARLQLGRAGRKPAAVQEAERRLVFAEEQLKLAHQNYERNLPLFESGVVPKAEFERIENAYRLAQIQREIAESELLVAETGKRPEEIGLLQARMQAQQTALDVLQNKAERYLFRAPFAGQLAPPDSVDEILCLENVDTLVLVVPIPLPAVAALGDSLQLHAAGYNWNQLALNCSRVYPLGQEEVCLLRLPLPAGEQIKIGSPLRCHVKGAPVSLWQYLKWWLARQEGAWL